MSAYRDPDSFEFADYFGVLRRRWWVVLVLAAAGLLAAGAYFVLTPKAYSATAMVNVTATGNAPGQNGAVAGGRTSGAINLDTEAQIVQSSTVAGIAAHSLHSPLAPAALVKHVSVSVPANSSVLQISCLAASADQAAACANAFAAAYLQNRNATAAAATKAALGTVQDQLTTLQKRMAQLTFLISQLPVNSTQRASDQAQLQTASSQLRALASQSAALTAQNASPTGGSIISKATPPAKPSSPKKLLALPSGLLAGLILGLIAAFAWDRRDTRVKDARDIERSGVPVLLSLSGNDLDGGTLVSARSAAGLEFTELARYAATALGAGNQLVVADTVAGRGASVVTANLAAALARTNDAVILVCPSQQDTPGLLGLPASQWAGAQDVADLASGAVSLDQAAQQPPGFPGLRVVILGAGLAELRHDQARELAQKLRTSADYVLVEAPRPESGLDSFAVAGFSDAVLLAVEISRSRHPVVLESIRRFDRLGIKVIGAAAVPRLRRASRPPRGREGAGLPAPRHRAGAAAAAQRVGSELPALWRRVGVELPARWRRVGAEAKARPVGAPGARPELPEPAADGDTADHAALSSPGHAETADRLSGT
jgi:capsular polysaccharide biosynthesis protein